MSETGTESERWRMIYDTEFGESVQDYTFDGPVTADHARSVFVAHHGGWVTKVCCAYSRAAADRTRGVIG